MPPQVGNIPESSYKVIFPWKSPSTPEERKIFEEYPNKPDKYMNGVRTLANAEWDIALLKVSMDVISKKISVSNLEELYRKNLELDELGPHINMEGIRAYQESQSHYNGTFVPSKPSYFQSLIDGRLIPMQISKTGKVKKTIGLKEWLRGKAQYLLDKFRSKKSASSKQQDYGFVYASEEPGNWDIFLGPERKNLTNHPGNDHSPAISPDGKKIAFVSDRKRGISEVYLMDMEGKSLEKAITLLQRGYIHNLRWIDQERLFFFVDPAKVSNTTGAYIKYLNGNSERIGMIIGYDNFSISPDKTKIVYDNEGSRIHILDLVNGIETRLFDTGGKNTEFIDWSPDGKKIMFNWITWKPPSHIYFIEPETKRTSSLETQCTILSNPQWSPKGDKITYFCATEHDVTLRSVNPDSSNDKKLLNLPDMSHYSDTPSNKVYWLSDSKIVFTNYLSEEKKIVIGEFDLNSPEPKYVFSFPCGHSRPAILNKTGVSFFKK